MSVLYFTLLLSDQIDLLTYFLTNNPLLGFPANTNIKLFSPVLNLNFPINVTTTFDVLNCCKPHLLRRTNYKYSFRRTSPSYNAPLYNMKKDTPVMPRYLFMDLTTYQPCNSLSITSIIPIMNSIDSPKY